MAENKWVSLLFFEFTTKNGVIYVIYITLLVTGRGLLCMNVDVNGISLFFFGGEGSWLVLRLLEVCL